MSSQLTTFIWMWRAIHFSSWFWIGSDETLSSLDGDKRIIVLDIDFIVSTWWLCSLCTVLINFVHDELIVLIQLDILVIEADHILLLLVLIPYHLCFWWYFWNPLHFIFYYCPFRVLNNSFLFSFLNINFWSLYWLRNNPIMRIIESVSCMDKLYLRHLIMYHTWWFLVLKVLWSLMNEFVLVLRRIKIYLFSTKVLWYCSWTKIDL